MSPNESLPAQRVSLRDIAEAVGLSHMAVSLALRDSPRISAEKRKLVKAMAEELGYRPDPMLHSLAAYRRGRLQKGIRSSLVWINQWDKPEALRSYKEFNSYWEGAQRAAERLGYRLEEIHWPYGQSGTRLQGILEARGVQGLLIPPQGRDINMPGFDWSGFSVIRFGVSVSNLPAHTITSDQSHCSRLGYMKAVSLGYTRVGYVSDPDFEKSTEGHFRGGFLNAQQQFTSRVNRVDSLLIGGDHRQNLKDVSNWLETQKPDAVLTTSKRFHALLDELHVRVPRDLAVATTSIWDGNFDAGADQNSEEVGRVAVSVVAGLILENERGLPSHPRRILVAGRWVDGASMPPKGESQGRGCAEGAQAVVACAAG